jgi:hypothetical protein
VQPGRSVPGKAARVNRGVLEQNVRLYGGEGPEQVAEKLARSGEKVRQIHASGEGVVDYSKTIKGLEEGLLAKLEKADRPEYAEKVRQYIADFKQMHPTLRATEAEALELKQAIFNTVPDKEWSQFKVTDPFISAKKAASADISKQLRTASPEVAPLNKEQSQLIRMRPDVAKAAERIQTEGGVAKLRGTVREKVAHALKQTPSNPEVIASERAAELSRIGSPFQGLEEMMGTQPQYMQPTPKVVEPPLGAGMRSEPMPPSVQLWDEAAYGQQLQPNLATAEKVPGTLMEGEVPVRGFTQPEGYGQVPQVPESTGRMLEQQMKPQYTPPEFDPIQGTLLEGEVPYPELYKLFSRTKSQQKGF